MYLPFHILLGTESRIFFIIRDLQCTFLKYLSVVFKPIFSCQLEQCVIYIYFVTFILSRYDRNII